MTTVQGKCACVFLSSTNQWGIRWLTALSQPDGVVDSSKYLAIANLKYNINANIWIQGASPSATIDEAGWWRYIVMETMKHWWRFLDQNATNCIFDVAAEEMSDVCSYSLYSFVLSQFCLVPLFVHVHHCVPCWLLSRPLTALSLWFISNHSNHCLVKATFAMTHTCIHHNVHVHDICITNRQVLT